MSYPMLWRIFIFSNIHSVILSLLLLLILFWPYNIPQNITSSNNKNEEKMNVTCICKMFIVIYLFAHISTGQENCGPQASDQNQSLIHFMRMRCHMHIHIYIILIKYKAFNTWKQTIGKRKSNSSQSSNRCHICLLKVKNVTYDHTVSTLCTK
jgi:hypothetical protein